VFLKEQLVAFLLSWIDLSWAVNNLNSHLVICIVQIDVTRCRLNDSLINLQ
jgi:hypothetical protein